MLNRLERHDGIEASLVVERGAVADSEFNPLGSISQLGILDGARVDISTQHELGLALCACENIRSITNATGAIEHAAPVDETAGKTITLDMEVECRGARCV